MTWQADRVCVEMKVEEEALRRLEAESGYTLREKLATVYQRIRETKGRVAEMHESMRRLLDQIKAEEGAAEEAT